MTREASPGFATAAPENTMPDSRVQLIRNARLQIGEAPRALAASEYRGLVPRKPLLAFTMNSGERAAYDAFEELLESGEVVWAALTLARNDLFGKGDHNGRGVVVYCPELHVHDDLERLVEASQALDRFRSSQSLAATDKPFKKQLNDNNEWFPPRALPTSIADDPRVWVSSVLVVRKHLPKRRLLASCLPLLVHPKQNTVAILPDRYWPREMKDYWK